MQRNKRLFPALLIGVSTLVVLNVPLHAQTLEQAIQATIQNHPSIETAKVGEDIAGEERREHRSGYFPTLAVSGQGGRIYGDNSTSRGLSTTRGAAYSNYWEGAFTARQMLYDGSETSNRVHSADAKKSSATMNLADVQERLGFSVAQAYLDLLRARAALSLLQAQATKVTDYEQRIDRMVDEGASDETEHQQAKDIRVILENMIADYQGQLHTAEAYYTELVGTPPPDELVMPAPRSDMIPPKPDEAVAYAIANHPALKSAEFLSQSAAYEAKAEKGVLYPDFDAEASYLESEKDDVIGGELTDARAVVRMNWEFETGGGQLARIEQKELRKKETLSRMHEMERQIERAIRLAYSEYETATKQADSQKIRYELNQKLFETYTVQFEGARITLLQLMQSDNQLFTTKLEKMNADFRALAARYAILAGMGRLQESLNMTVAQASSSSPVLTRPSADDKE